MPDNCTLVKTSPAQEVPPIERNRAVSVLVPFEVVRPLLEGRPSPRRPNRNRPVNNPDREAIASLKIALRTPSLAELRALAASNPPPSEFFDGDMERPW
jgi:hypothetical protein